MEKDNTNMIYATMCIGNEFISLYKDIINSFSENNNLHIITDNPNEFPNAHCYEYNRDVFSYYEKLPFILSLVLNNKDRVLYFDADSIELIEDKEFIFDNNSVYSYKIYEHKSYTEEELRKDEGMAVMLDIYQELGYKMCDYLHERILSIPYSEKIPLILEEIVELQPLFEERYPKGKNWDTPSRDDIQSFSNVGCGYGEGGALSVVLKNNNINVKTLKENKLI